MPKINIPEAHETELNLIPIMNLFTALIPFLLLSAAFFHMGVIQISVPVASDSGETDIAKEEDKVTLTMRIMNDKFELSGSSDTIDPRIIKTLRATVTRTMGNEEAAMRMYQQVSEAAFKIKGKYTASETVIMVPDLDIPYDEVVAAMDAVRSFSHERDGISSRVALFPKVVLSTLVSE